MPIINGSGRNGKGNPVADTVKILSQVRRVRRVPGGEAGGPEGGPQGRTPGDRKGSPVAALSRFISQYVSLPIYVSDVIALWVVASFHMQIWDRFPHLGITSPEGRCGKTRLLELLKEVCVEPYIVSNPSPASIYRKIAATGGRYTLLIDEAQNMGPGGSENGQAVRELLCASISKKATVPRCSGPNFDVKEYSCYCPKVVARIGMLDGVLADRCLPVPMVRKMADEGDDLATFRYRKVEAEAAAIKQQIEEWTNSVSVLDRLQTTFDATEPFNIPNDRLAELLVPLMAVSKVSHEDGGCDYLPHLLAYANNAIKSADELSRMSLGSLLMKALSEIYSARVFTGEKIIPTSELISQLIAREEEPWGSCNQGRPITPEWLADKLKPYGVTSVRNKAQTYRGYTLASLAPIFKRYVSTPGKPSDPSDVSGQSKGA